MGSGTGAQGEPPGRGGLATPATVALSRAGVPFKVHPYRHHPATTSYGQEAAAALGVPETRIYKTLLVEVDGPGLTVAVLPVADQLDLKALASAMGARRARLADPEVAARATGYVVGGISPVGQRRTHPTVVDTAVTELPTVFVSAGRRGLQVELAPADLLRVTRARTAPLGRRRAPG